MTRGRGAAAVSVVTAHGRQLLEGRRDERLLDLLHRHRIPWSAVAVYVRVAPGEPLVLAPRLDARLGEIGAEAEVFLYFNRNINPFVFSVAGYEAVPTRDGSPEATEYFYQRLDNERGDASTYLKRLSADEAKEIVAARVADTVNEFLPGGGELVVGVSGGGDSNALLYGLSLLHERDVTVHPVMLTGIPDWDSGVPRAQRLCDSYGLKLRVVEEREVQEVLGMYDSDAALLDRFERYFPGDDFEFLGTLLIRLVLTAEARSRGAQSICTGLNLEDVVCEAMFRVANGLKPAGIPQRQVGDVGLLFPLWLCPKRIIDGCFPTLSLDNYEARYPGFSLGRNLYYSVVYNMQSSFPGFVETFAQGLSQASRQDPVDYHFDDQLGFHVERFVPFPLRRRFEAMLGRSSTR
ncbi:MAG: hypothetical protein MSC31_17560 [Solirubrobacteraceae bacterium MAG38_C4-C5]|nr:hypothetical protein [Candidatus Siliceabacter maunaloa]